VICETAGRSVELAEGILTMELAKAVDDWSWRNGRIDNMSKVGLGYFGELVVERAKDRMENIAGSEGPIAWCGFKESCFIFFFNFRKMGQSLVRWSVSLP
jgi:hypothetical protein